MPLRHFTDPQILESDKTLVLYFLFYFDFTQFIATTTEGKNKPQKSWCNWNNGKKGILTNLIFFIFSSLPEIWYGTYFLSLFIENCWHCSTLLQICLVYNPTLPPEFTKFSLSSQWPFQQQPKLRKQLYLSYEWK